MINNELKYTERERRRLSEHGHSYRRSSKSKLILFLMLGLALETVLLMFLIVNVGMLEKENSELATLEKQQSQEISQATPELEKLRKEIAALVEDRLPNLTKLEFDKVVPLDKGYVKNVVFTLAGTNDEKHYEYKLVLHNNSLSPVHPQVDILFFNRVGIQVGLSQIGIRKDGTPTLDVIERGEIRSFSSALDLDDGVAPEYFMVQLKTAR